MKKVLLKGAFWIRFKESTKLPDSLIQDLWESMPLAKAEGIQVIIRILLNENENFVFG